MSNVDFVDKDLVVLKVPNEAYANRNLVGMDHVFNHERIEDETILEDEKEKDIS